MKKGKLIVIEGADGTGKSTQTDLLKSRLQKSGYRVDLYDFPQYEKTFFGSMVGRFLKGEFGKLNEVNPYIVSVFYAADRWQAKNQLEKTLSKGRIALLNRYALSSMAFQGVKVAPQKRSGFIKYVSQMEYEVFGIPKEDINVILTVPPKLSQRLIKMKAQRGYLGKRKKRDIHEKDIKFQFEVSQFYRSIAKRNKVNKKIVLIDCSTNNGNLESIEQIHNKIWKEVEKVLS